MSGDKKEEEYSIFTHPNTVCMTYFEHMKLSFGFSKTFLAASVKAFVHGVFPCCYIKSTTDTYKKIGTELDNAGCNKAI